MVDSNNKLSHSQEAEVSYVINKFKKAVRLYEAISKIDLSEELLIKAKETAEYNTQSIQTVRQSLLDKV